MTDVSYVPGAWTAVAGDGCWALINAAPDSVTVREIWQRIEDGASLDTLMASLLRTGLRDAPDFALLATHDGSRHLFCRGRGAATVNTDGTSERLAGTGLVTWREHPVAPDAGSVVLGASSAGTDLQLPASAGVFLAQSVTIALTGAGHRRAETSPAVPVAPAASVSGAGATLSYPGAGDWIPGGEAVSVVPDATAREGTDARPPEETGYDFLFGATQLRTVEDAAVRPVTEDGPPPELAAAAAPAPLAPPPLAPPDTAPPYTVTGPEDDSGATARRADPLTLPSRVASSDRIGPAVHALLCPSAHPSPPGSPACRVCGVPLRPHDPVTVPRPVLGVLWLSTGDVITLDHGVVMGRSPRTDFDGEERPHIVKLPSGDGEISRTHLEVSLDGWRVLVTDLKSTNGTLVTLPGRDPERLRPGEPFQIQPGTVVTLADDIYFRYEEPQ